VGAIQVVAAGAPAGGTSMLSRETGSSNTDGSGGAGISPAIQLEKGVPTAAVKSGSAN
jgi:hypothetical protein